MIVYVGMHHPADADVVPRAMVSFNALEGRRGDFPVHDWILDSGAFTRIMSGRGHVPVAEYAAAIKRWSRCGALHAAVAQDYMCEAPALRATGLTVAEHQELSTRRYLDLREAVDCTYVLPVLQGFEPSEYAAHTRALSPELPEGAWVGVGSVCKRQGDPGAIVAVLDTILRERPDLRLHGFGVKATSMRSPLLTRWFHSIDSMAWSYAARRQGRDANDPAEAVAWLARLEEVIRRGRRQEVLL